MVMRLGTQNYLLLDCILSVPLLLDRYHIKDKKESDKGFCENFVILGKLMRIQYSVQLLSISMLNIIRKCALYCSK